jgi:hypothetical protein
VSALRLQRTSPLTELCLCLKKNIDKEVATCFETVKMCSVNSVMSDTQNTFVNNVINLLPDGDSVERSNRILKRNGTISLKVCNMCTILILVECIGTESV